MQAVKQCRENRIKYYGNRSILGADTWGTTFAEQKSPEFGIHT